MTPDEILRKAASLIQERGLAKSTIEDEKGCVCSIGALRLAAYGSTHPPLPIRTLWLIEDPVTGHNKQNPEPPPGYEGYSAACIALRDEIRLIGAGSGSIPEWNDMPSRSQRAVVQTMYEAANRYQREHS